MSFLKRDVGWVTILGYTFYVKEYKNLLCATAPVS
jgi:hypothetical protein